MELVNIALLVLTLTAEGEVRMTLSDMEDIDTCESTELMIQNVLNDAGYTIIDSMCGDSALVLEPYNHGATAADEIHRYRVEVAGQGGFLVSPLTEGEACEAAPEASPAVYCTRSSQAVLR